MDASIKALHKNFMEWMAGPTGSIVIHVALVLALIFLVDLSVSEKTQEIEVQMIEVDEQILDEPLEELEPEEIPEMVETVTPPEVDMEMTPPEVDDFTADPIMDQVVELDIASDAISPIIMKNLAPGNMKNRSGTGREASIGRYGGDWGKFAEIAVLKALEWLRINQNADGSWGTSSPDKDGYAGLGLLTFLAHGETVNSEKYGDTVEKAIRYLLARQNDKGAFTKTEGAGGVYAHAIATYAICEAYGMTRIPSLKGAMERAVQVLLDGQMSYGGWVMYSYDKEKADTAKWDVSLSGFCIQALKAGYIAGAENQGLKAAMDNSADFLAKRQKEDGGFPYSAANPGRQPNMTAVGVLCLQLLGHGKESAAQTGLGVLAGVDCSWKQPEQAPLYSWYYVSQAKFHQGGASWAGWNNKFAPTLIKNQNPDGSWLSPGLDQTGDGVEREYRGEEVNSKVYATTLAALTLQVYYRFLPTYQPIQAEAVDQTSDEDVKIEIL